LAVRLIAVRRDGVVPAGADATLADTDGHAHELWGAQAGAVYVLRPDQHVCARWMAGRPTRVADAIGRIFDPATTAAAAPAAFPN
jgi:3-(3-hydroxy-phenyl)propionate hydroxylase